MWHGWFFYLSLGMQNLSAVFCYKKIMKVARERKDPWMYIWNFAISVHPHSLSSYFIQLCQANYSNFVGFTDSHWKICFWNWGIDLDSKLSQNLKTNQWWTGLFSGILNLGLNHILFLHNTTIHSERYRKLYVLPRLRIVNIRAAGDWCC